MLNINVHYRLKDETLTSSNNLFSQLGNAFLWKWYIHILGECLRVFRDTLNSRPILRLIVDFQLFVNINHTYEDEDEDEEMASL